MKRVLMVALVSLGALALVNQTLPRVGAFIAGNRVI
jgi:hypothetical protein